jgi:hypothetical protein
MTNIRRTREMPKITNGEECPYCHRLFKSDVGLDMHLNSEFAKQDERHLFTEDEAREYFGCSQMELLDRLNVVRIPEHRAK